MIEIGSYCSNCDRKFRAGKGKLSHAIEAEAVDMTVCRECWEDNGDMWSANYLKRQIESHPDEE